MITWNMANRYHRYIPPLLRLARGRSPFALCRCPSADQLPIKQLLGERDSDLLMVATQESAEVRRWQTLLSEALGEGWQHLGSDQLGQIHASVFSRVGSPLQLTRVLRSQVACGVANVLGNKGAVGFSLLVNGHVRLLLVNAHMAAHEHKASSASTAWLGIQGARQRVPRCRAGQGTKRRLPKDPPAAVS